MTHPDIEHMERTGETPHQTRVRKATAGNGVVWVSATYKLFPDPDEIVDDEWILEQLRCVKPYDWSRED